MEEKNFFTDEQSAFKAIEDAIRFLGEKKCVEGLVVLCPTKKSTMDGMMQLFAGTELDVATCLMMASGKSNNIKEVIRKTGRIIDEKWDEYMAETNRAICDGQEAEGGVADE